MPTKPRTGEKVTWKEFFRQWKQGMRDITQLQQAQVTQFGHVVSAIGVIWGIIFSFRLGYWWMAVILIGGMIVLSMQYVGNWQRKKIFEEIENISKTMEPQFFQINREEVKNVVG